MEINQNMEKQKIHKILETYISWLQNGFTSLRKQLSAHQNVTNSCSRKNSIKTGLLLPCLRPKWTATQAMIAKGPEKPKVMPHISLKYANLGNIHYISKSEQVISPTAVMQKVPVHNGVKPIR